MTFLLIDKLCKRYGAMEAVASSSLAIEKGEFVSLLGPSGLSLIHISEPTRPRFGSRMPSSA